MSIRAVAAATLLLATAWAQPELAIARDGTLPGITAAFSGRQGLTDIHDQYGQGLLEYAAVANPDPEVIRFLVNLGFDVNRQTPAGWSPLMYAVHFNPIPEVAAVLIELGANASITNHDGRTAADLVQHNPNPTYALHAVMGLLTAATPASPPASTAVVITPPAAPPQPQAPRAACVDINTASAAELQRIIHIGTERAQELIRRRPYASVGDLTRISGIGASRIRDIQNQGLACVIR